MSRISLPFWGSVNVLSGKSTTPVSPCFGGYRFVIFCQILKVVHAIRSQHYIRIARNQYGDFLFAPLFKSTSMSLNYWQCVHAILAMQLEPTARHANRGSCGFAAGNFALGDSCARARIVVVTNGS